jgi:hypothetical protein
VSSGNPTTIETQDLAIVQHALEGDDPATIGAALKTVIQLERLAAAAGDTIDWPLIDRLTDAMINAMPLKASR